MSAFFLHLLRHGAPETSGLLLGRTDLPSTTAGVRRCVAQARGLCVDQLQCSDLGRARVAADAISSEFAIPVRQDRRWRELDFGQWDGLSPDQVEPAALAAFWADPDGAAPPGGERWLELVSRVAQAISELRSAPTLVVTHAGAMRAALHHLCKIPQAQCWAFHLPYAALLTLRVWPGEEPAAQIYGLRG